MAEYLLEEIPKLARAGADFGLIAANTPHVVFDDVAPKSPIEPERPEDRGMNGDYPRQPREHQSFVLFRDVQIKAQPERHRPCDARREDIVGEDH